MALDKFKNFLSGKDDSVNDSDEEYYNEEAVLTDSYYEFYWSLVLILSLNKSQII